MTKPIKKRTPSKKCLIKPAPRNPVHAAGKGRVSPDKADVPEPVRTTNRRGTPPRFNKRGEPLFTEVSVFSKIKQDKILQTYGFITFSLVRESKARSNDPRAVHRRTDPEALAVDQFSLRHENAQGRNRDGRTGQMKKRPPSMNCPNERSPKGPTPQEARDKPNQHTRSYRRRQG